MADRKPYWWEELPAERFWMETVARPEYGTRLLAPYGRGGDGTDMPFHATVDRVHDGDVVLHWVTGGNHRFQGFVGFSRVSGLPFPVDSVEYEDAVPLPGRAALLRGYTPFPEPVSRAMLHNHREKIYSVKSALKERVDSAHPRLAKALLFPFNAYGHGREIRVHQGAYLSKFPRELFDILPKLVPARDLTDIRGERVNAEVIRVHGATETRGDRRRARESGDLGDASTRRAVELHALRRARQHLGSDGSAVTDVGPSRSFDLLLSPAGGGPERQVIVRGSTEQVDAIELSAPAIDEALRRPTDLVLVHDIRCERDGADSVATGGDLEHRHDWRPSVSTLTPIMYRATV
ncbi:hypothetical protein [Brachybacterium squillarum]|uniref:hypothetical protein n=1 Tax=Brachybacterium squillarum TaxID=661979 RepID=UPI002223AE7C|nr:hypothetical protein [Brachybacterium squillarum]MCW1804354.1 hypothetical protein [Brachybacterium squillarum]